MKSHPEVALILLAAACFLPTAARACSTFVLENDGHALFAKNFDWIPVPAYVMINKRGVAKTTVPADNGTAITWTSTYGSITFHWEAREKPFEGINEAGLFISAKSMTDLKKLPDPDKRPAMPCGQWVQYVLDNFSTVDEIIASDSTMRIEDPVLQYLAHDRQGNCAIIEYPYGEMICHTGEDLPIKLLVNCSYDESLEVLSRFQGFGGWWPVPRTNLWKYTSMHANCYHRFVRAADMLRKYDPEKHGAPVAYAFQILDTIPMLGLKRAVWQSVYDPDNGRIYFQSYNSNAVRYFDINAFDFSCATPVTVLDVNADLAGDVTDRFVDYTESISREMMESNRETPLFTLTDEYIDFWATYPEKYTYCTDDADTATGSACRE